MKKLSFYLMMMVLLLNAFPNNMNATEKKLTATPNNGTEVPAKVKTILTRLDEIKAMDKSSLKLSDRKALRKEVRAINTELRTTNSGVYISVGAIIIILLLIIIL